MWSDKIMDATNQGLGVFEHYIPSDFKVGKAFSSPFREDKNPSFSVFLDPKSGRYLYKDFALGTGGDSIQFTAQLYNEDHKSACKRIARDFNINLAASEGGVVRGGGQKTSTPNNPPTTPQQSPPSHPTTPTPLGASEIRKLVPFELDYWSQFGIDERILCKYGVQALVASTQSNPQFVYQYGMGCKVYRPLQSQRFFYKGEREEDFIFGFDQLPDKGLYLVFAAGEKDVMTLSARGYHAITLNSESADIQEELLKKLRKRFRYLMVCYDVDAAGVRATKKQCGKHPSLIPLTLPLSGTKQSKDVSDFFKEGRSKEDFGEVVKKSIHLFFKQSLQELKDNAFNFDREVKEPVAVCTMEGQKMLTGGNLTVIAGKAKSGKSAVCQSVISGAIAKEGADKDRFFLGLDVIHNFEKKAVLHFDTEQSKFDYHKKVKNCIYNAGYSGNVEFFKSFHLLEFTPWERLKYIEHCCHYYSLAFNGIYLMVIDGVADLVSSVNDEESCNKLVDTLHRIATDHGAAILLVLHLNPDGGKTRGHLGSQLDRKAESIILIETEGTMHNINPKYCRNAGSGKVGLPQFAWNDDLRKFDFIGSKSPQVRMDRKKVECEELLEIARIDALEWKRSDLRDLIIEQNGLGRSAAYDLITFMVQEGLLSEEEDGTLKIL